MADRRGVSVFSIPAQRGFADALVAGLIARHGGGDLGLARLTVLLPNRRAARTLTEAFVRAGTQSPGAGGLLLPRMVALGDVDEDQAGLDAWLGALVDDDDLPPAVDARWRWLRLAALLAEDAGETAAMGAGLLRRAREMARGLDRLAIERIAPERLLAPEIVALVKEQARHWEEATRTFLRVAARWRLELDARGMVDPAVRRNMLFDRLAEAWRVAPPGQPIIAAGITSAAPAVARLLRRVAELPQGAVVLPDCDLGLAAEVWEALGQAGVAEAPGGAPFGRDEAATHPQYHLKLLLNRMGVARGEVRPWHRVGPAAASTARGTAISNLFLPAKASAVWAELPAAQRRLAGVRLMASAHPGEEAQAIAILIREAMETPGRRVALVTPDRSLAGRVVAHLRRWEIAADDTAGEPLGQTAAGRLILLLADVVSDEAAPVPLVALLTHPLVRAGEGRARWLETARRFELRLRGPRPAPGLAPLRGLAARADDAALASWWSEAEAILAPLFALGPAPLLAEAITALAAAGEALCGDALWDKPDGRALAAWLDAITLATAEAPTSVERRELAAIVREAMADVAVRPPWGGHPRVAIYGLLEARLARADLMIAGGLVEGVWPAAPAPDPLVPPPVLRQLGVPPAEYRIGLAAHDLAAVLGAPEVVLSWAERDMAGPVVPSRFVMRVRAMLGDPQAARGAALLDSHIERQAPLLARAIDAGRAVPPAPRPAPRPSAAQRRVAVSATALDRLRGDPFQFYASHILRLRTLDPLDAAPNPAWRGKAVHAILDAWHRAGERPDALLTIAHAVLDAMTAHPLSRALWRPRLIAGLEWVAERVLALKPEGRKTLATETMGAIERHGVRIEARADRIDRLGDGSLAIVDYKTGQPPSPRQVQEGFALQLGITGLIAQAGGFAGIAGEPRRFEYWSLAKSKQSGLPGYCEEPIPDGKRRTAGIPRDEFLACTAEYLDEALARWILGEDPFTARENPDLKSYNDYDQLMRLEEWIGLLGAGGHAEAGQ